MSNVKKVISKPINISITNTQNDIKPNIRVIETYQCSWENYDLLQNSVSENKIYIANEIKQNSKSI